MLSERVLNMNESATLAMAQKARELKSKGVDIVSMSLGEPDFGAPEFLRNAAIKAIEDDFSSYTPVVGFKDLRQAISNKLKRDNDLDYSEDQIIVSTGAKQSIANLILSLINPGDEVIIPAPYWVSYEDVIKFAGGKPVILKTSIENDFKVSPEQVRNSITSKTKLFLFSNPCNPSGTMYFKDELIEIGEVFKGSDIIIASDEIYEYIVFEGEHFSIGALDSLKNQVVTINGLSKAYAVTGWRLGYLAGPTEIVKACSKIQSQFTSGANSVAQKAAIAALESGNSKVLYMREAFFERRNFLIEQMKKKVPHAVVNSPQGAFYLFPDLKYYLDNSKLENVEQLSEYLLTDALVACTPGSAFGGDTNIRMSYALSLEDIEKAVDRIATSLDKLIS